MLKTGLLVVAFALALAGAGTASAQEQEQIAPVRADDAAMNAAKAKAIASLPDFYGHLAKPAGDETQFMLKFDILPGEDAEFVWASGLELSGGSIRGVLVNQPAYTDDKIGDRVTIAEADIIDWAYFKGTVLQGGYTNRVLVDLLRADEAEQMRRAYGW